MRTSMFSGAVKFASGERQVQIIASDPTPDRQGDILEPLGVDLTNFKKVPSILWMHRPDSPVARAVDISATARAVTATVQFPPDGENDVSDKVYKMIRSGVVNAVSVGFLPIASSPLPKGGQRFTKWELLEISFVSIPANPSAVITARAALSPREAARQRVRALLAIDPGDAGIRERARRTLAELERIGQW